MVGRTVIEKLLSYGHEILNVDQTPLDNPNVHTLKADLTDGAQAFNALSCHFKIGEPFLDELRTPDVVIHLAGTYLAMFSDLAYRSTERDGNVKQKDDSKPFKLQEHNSRAFIYSIAQNMAHAIQASPNPTASPTTKPSASTPSPPTP